MTFEQARKVADAVLFEGYVLYPYRASAQKNQARWQFGVLVPRAWSEAGSGEPWSSQTECLVDPGDGRDAVLEARVRFLRLQTRTVTDAASRPVASLEVDGSVLPAWDEGVEEEAGVEVALAALAVGERVVPIELAGGRDVAPVRDSSGALVGRVVRERWPVSALLTLAAERLDGPYGLVRLRVRTENLTPWAGPGPAGSGGHAAGGSPGSAGVGGHPADGGGPGSMSPRGAERDLALRRSLAGAHTLLAVSSGAFVSLLDPPEWAAPAVASCVNAETFPVLVGEPGRPDVVLSSPIILYDHPVVAPESPGDLFDATEIDEILTLRTMALTDEEKREARGTDQRAAAIIDRVDAMPAEVLGRLHGAVRYPEPQAVHYPEPQAIRLPGAPVEYPRRAGVRLPAGPGCPTAAPMLDRLSRGGGRAAGTRERPP